MNNFCVYKHIRLDKNIPFYVGKGVPQRPQQRSGRNKYWKNIVNKTDYVIEIISNNLTEGEACKKEKEFIKLYKSKGWCEANLAEGGVGGSTNLGKKFSLETKEKMAKAQIGKKSSDQTRLKMSLAHGGKSFLVWEAIILQKATTNKPAKYKKGKFMGEWVNQSECARDLNIKQGYVSLCLKNKQKSHKGFIFKYKGVK